MSSRRPCPTPPADRAAEVRTGPRKTQKPRVIRGFYVPYLLLLRLDELDHREGDGEEHVAVAVKVGHLDRPARRLLHPRPDSGAEDATLVHLNSFQTGLAGALK